MPRQRYQKKTLSATQRKEVKKLVMAPMEKKNFPWYFQDFEISTTHTVVDLTAVAQGDGEQSRDGDSIKITGMYGRGVLFWGDAVNMIRLTVIRWKCNSVPTAAQIYDTTAIGTNGGMFSSFNHKYRDNFVVISDKYVDIDSYHPYKQVIIKAGAQPKTTFNGAATTGGNKLFLILSSDSSAAGHPSLTMRADVHYIDA